MKNNTVTLTGKTYDARRQLKDWGATYDGASRSWKMSAAQWEKFQDEFPILSSGIRVSGQQRSASPICPHCHTVCYGDCLASS